VSSATGVGAGAGAGFAIFLATAFFLAAAFFAAFLGFSGSSGETSRIRPSRSALRRTRSACASMMLEE
jgi:hypothetical protein